MSIFPKNIQFRGEWRPYQRRILDDLDALMVDHKLHLVAAPGSGKTTVGLEIIRRIGQPCLILAPSITIREQWIDRFCASFLPQTANPELWVSRALSAPKPITAVTYQALHHAYVNHSDNSSDELSSEKSVVSVTDAPYIKRLKEAGIRTICLDEAHHLRNEWWNALEQTANVFGETLKTIALTATPPYDATAHEWQRYINLCGETDAEIFTPELVKANNLCPHQDYVFFNWPDRDEQKQMTLFRQSAFQTVFEIARNEEFIHTINQHPGILHADDYAELFLSYPSYLTALMVFLNSNGIQLPDNLRALIGHNDKLPKLSLHWMEILLQEFIYDDYTSYPDSAGVREKIEHLLKERGHIYRKRVMLTANKAMDKLLISSKGKMNSIEMIVRAEYKELHESLRLLLLTDYIKGEMLSSVGKTDDPVQVMGAVPIFEKLRRSSIAGLKLGVLSGRVVIIPKSSIQALDKLAARKKIAINYSLINETDYMVVRVRESDSKQMVGLITDLFTIGGIHVLIGTKSLLGEGWDSPCVNALILASFVGSYMLSNQMRGRAIRVSPDNPEKTANIWHLVSLEPPLELNEKISDLLTNESDTSWPQSEDFQTLHRRFQAFLGLSYTKDTIEDGLDRLSIIKPPFSKKNVAQINQEMLHIAANREALRKRWQAAIAACPDASQVIDINKVEKPLIPGQFLFFNAILHAVVSFWLLIALQILPIVLTLSGVQPIAIILSIITAVYLSKYIYQLMCLLTPQGRLKKLGKGLLEALKEIEAIDSYNTRVTTFSGDAFVCCYLDGGTTHEKSVFNQSITELLQPIGNPRYILLIKNQGLRMTQLDYYAVPEIFGVNKTNAQQFTKWMNRMTGTCQLVYTRNPEGRRVLLKARTNSFMNRNAYLLDKTRKVKSKWE